jgi:hypothetical protein
MYFVTTKHPDYTLFCMTPSERFAVGVTETQVVRLLARGPTGDWAAVREWDGRVFSHTAFMSALHRRVEPEHVDDFLALLPPDLR